MTNLLSLDFETTGLDLFHAAGPFCAVWCDGTNPGHLEWPVDPLTRDWTPPDGTADRIRDLVSGADRVVFHNSKFDVRCLSKLGIELDWARVEDTMVAGHVLYSAPPHNLTRLADRYLDTDISGYERAVEAAVKRCRRIVQQARLKEGRRKTTIPDLSPLRHWAISAEDDPDAPSTGDDVWRADYWLPAAVYAYDPEDPDVKGFDTVLHEYALVDAAVTYRLWEEVEVLLRRRGLWKVYRAKMEILPALYRMEARGLGVRREVLRDATERYTAESEAAGGEIERVADELGYPLQMPKGATNHNLDDFVFGRAGRTDGKRDAKSARAAAPDTLNLPVVDRTESGSPSFGADARAIYAGTLSAGSPGSRFVTAYARKSELDKGLSYLAAYERFLLPDGHGGYVIHPSFRATGTQTTRLSCENPNAQNISLRSAVNLRHAFGPKPGRVWYSMDAANIELRIPAYLAGESELIDVFERPDDPPYFGSYHLLIFSVLHPDTFAAHGKSVKEDVSPFFPQYKRVKNGNFARQYGAGTVGRRHLRGPRRVPSGGRPVPEDRRPEPGRGSRREPVGLRVHDPGHLGGPDQRVHDRVPADGP